MEFSLIGTEAVSVEVVVHIIHFGLNKNKLNFTVLGPRSEIR